MSLLLKQAQIFSKLVATSVERVKIEDVIEAQENARIAVETARWLYGAYKTN
jgi:hypothetical protein